MAKDTLIRSWANTHGEETGDLVTSRFGDAQAYGDTLKLDVQTYMSALDQIAYTPHTFTLDTEYPTDPSVVDMTTVTNKPDDLELDEIPDSDDVISSIDPIEDLPSLSLVDIPEYNEDDITFSEPRAPDEFDENPPDVVGINPDGVTQTDPELISISTDDFNDIIIPPSPSIDHYEFSGVRPTCALVVPDLVLSFEEGANAYESCIKTNLPAKICAVLAGEDALILDSDITDDILTTAVETLGLELAKSEDEVLTEWALKGHDLPQGAMLGRLDELRSESDRNKTGVIRDIGIKQSELAIDAMKHAMSVGTQYEGLLMEQFNQIQTRAFEVAKAGLDVGLKKLESQIAICTAETELYRADAQVFEALQKGNIAIMDGYKTEMEGAKIHGELIAEEVKAELATNEISVKIYETIIKGKAEIERLKVEIVKLEIEIFNAKINAKGLEYNGYETAAKVELGKAQVAETKVRGYTARVDGLSRKNEAEVQKLMAVVEKNKGIAITNQSRLDVFRAEVMAISEKNTAEATGYGAKMEGYKELIRVAISNYEGILKRYQADMNLWDTKAKLALEEAKEDVRIAVQEYELSIRAAETGAKVYSQLAASAMNMVNASASVGFSGSNTNSSSADRTKAYETFSHNETLSISN